VTHHIPKIAYLAGEYPAVSHTFILREVAALRSHGFEVATFSARRTDPTAHHRGPEERAAAQTTFYLVAAARRPFFVLKCQLAAMARPRRWFAALALALRTAPPGIGRGIWQMFYFAEAAILSYKMRKLKVEHLHNHFEEASCTVAMLASALSGIPYSFTMHGPLVFFDAHRWRLDAKIARARFVACISEFCRSQAMLFSAPDQWSKLHIVHCGVEPARYSADDTVRNGTRVLFVGRLAAMKGVPVLLDAFAQLTDRHPDARLTLIGDGPERQHIEAAAASLGVEDRVHFAGYRSQEEVATELSRTDLFVLPSFAEGVPVVLMEALASGVPVVTTRIAGIPELVEHDTNGLVVSPGNVDTLAEAMSDLLSDPRRRARMAVAGRRKVEAEHDATKEAAWMGQLLADYTSDQPPSGRARPDSAP
jgi:glycosyltransferase involved in cell wall biosynthesis